MTDSFSIDATSATPSDAPVKKKNILDSLKDQLAASVLKPPVVKSVPGRPLVTLAFDINIEADEINVWRRSCKDKTQENSFNSLKFSCIVLANKNTEIHLNGELATDDEGEPLTLRSAEIHRMLSATTAIPAVRALYGYDGHILTIGGELLEAAGYGDEGTDTEADPTLIS